MAGNVCSYPGCQVHTHGAKADGIGSYTVGIACHIKAASPEGPRYDPSQTKDERRHINNGIWMCANHARMIDADDSPYTVETLREWKRAAEERSNSMVNERAYSEAEVQSEALKQSADMVGRIFNPGSGDIGSVVSKVISGFESKLEDLDPRFKVEINAVGGRVHHLISPKAPDASFQVVVTGTDEIPNFREAERALFEEGRELQIPGEHFKFEGSKLFEAISPRKGEARNAVLSISGVKWTMQARLFVCNSQGRELFLEQFYVSSTSGFVRYVVEGRCLDGLFTVKGAMDRSGGPIKFDLQLDLASWRGLDVARISCVPKVIKSLGCLRDGGYFAIELEHDGMHARIDSQRSDEVSSFVESFIYIMDAVNWARTLASHCDRPVLVSDLQVDGASIRRMREYAALLVGPEKRKFTQPTKLRFHEYDEEDLLDSGILRVDSHSVKITEPEGREVNIFGQLVKAPRRVFTYYGVCLNFYCDLDCGGELVAHLQPGEGSEIEFALLVEDPWMVVS